MPEPKIKGIAFVGVIDDVQALLATDALTQEELEKRLDAQDLDYFDEEIAPGFWYPMGSYDRLLQLLIEESGESDPEPYLRRRGERAMQRMMELGVYNQFASLEQGWTRLAGRVMSTIGESVYNFLSFEYVDQPAPDGVRRSYGIRIQDGGRLSDAARMTIEGAVAALSSRAAEGAVKVVGGRTDPDTIELQVTRLGV